MNRIADYIEVQLNPLHYKSSSNDYKPAESSFIEIEHRFCSSRLDDFKIQQFFALNSATSFKAHFGI